MPFINEAMVDGARLIVRQTLSPTSAASVPLSTILSSLASSGTSALSASISSTVTSAVASATTSTSISASPSEPAASPSPTQPAQQNNGSSSSPLLFFVALGFGVVFTNLWIIVGVKYCFRYNARNRRMRLNGEGEPINLETVPHPRRRRREKKLMTMEEVNEKFPMQKYKSWVAGRAQEGLPTRGGVTAPSSRANSVLSADGIVPELPSQPRESTDTQDRPTTSATSAEKPEAGAGQEKKNNSTTTFVDAASTNEVQGLATIPETHAENETEAPLDKTRTSHDEEDEDDDEHIDAALPPECLGTSGDTCAICIDTLEDDDDVRGLTCGHAFHAGCLDPWLTSRRACCPLCKADYYTPKPPRVDGPQTGDATTGVVVVNLDDQNSRMNMPSRPGHTWLGVRGRGMVLPSRFANSNQGQTGDTDGALPQRGERSGRSRIGFFGRDRLYSASTADAQPAPATEPESQPQGRFPALREAFPSRFVPFRRERRSSTEANSSTGAATNEVTPSNLEAGLRPGPGQ